MITPYGPFSLEYPGHDFVFFSAPHLGALTVLAAIYAALWIFRKWFENPDVDLWTRRGIAALLIIQETSLSLWRLSNGSWDAGSSLPLHLCGMGIVLAFAQYGRFSSAIRAFGGCLGV